MDTAAAIQANQFGHCRLDPALFTPPEHHKQRPAILTALTEKLGEYFYSPDLLPSLNNANDSTRKQRSERRESCISLLGAYLHYTDLETLRIGRPASLGQFKGLTMEFLAKVAGLPLRRAERANSDLVRAGIIKVHKICNQVADDKFIGLAAIRTLSKYVFEAFGLGKRLHKERRKAYNRHNKRPATEEQKGRAGLAVNAINNRLNNPTTANMSPAEHLAALKASRPPG